MQTEEKNNETKRGRAERRNCLRKCFHSFKYVIEHANVRFFFYVDSLHCFRRFRLYYLLHLLSSDRFAALTSLQPYKFLIWICEFFKNHPRRVFCNVNLSNLENLLQGNLEEKISKIFRLAATEWHLRGIDVYTSLLKKTLDTSLLFLMYQETVSNQKQILLLSKQISTKLKR